MASEVHARPTAPGRRRARLRRAPRDDEPAALVVVDARSRPSARRGRRPTAPSSPHSTRATRGLLDELAERQVERPRRGSRRGRRRQCCSVTIPRSLRHRCSRTMVNVGLVTRSVTPRPRADALDERRLARAERAREQHDVAGREDRGELLARRRRGRGVGAVAPPAHAGATTPLQHAQVGAHHLDHAGPRAGRRRVVGRQGRAATDRDDAAVGRAHAGSTSPRTSRAATAPRASTQRGWTRWSWSRSQGRQASSSSASGRAVARAAGT